MTRAGFEAVEAGARDIRAEHLLLAMFDGSTGESADGRVRAVLAGLGLDHARLIEALRAERTHSLAAAGFSELAAERLSATRLPSTPAMGSSARDALLIGHRTLSRDRMLAQREAHRRRGRGIVDPFDGNEFPRGRGRPGTAEFALAVGVLSAELGTVPRALALAGFDREALLQAVRRAAQEA